MSATDSLDMRFQSSLKQGLECATTLSDASSLTNFVEQKICEEKENITLSSRAFDDFITACEYKSLPGKTLKQAALEHDAKCFS